MLNPSPFPSGSGANSPSKLSITSSAHADRALQELGVLRAIADHDRELEVEGSTAEQVFLTHLDIAAQSTLNTIADGIIPSRILRTFNELQRSIQATAPGSHAQLRLQEVMHVIRGVLSIADTPLNLLRPSTRELQYSNKIAQLPVSALIERVRAWHNAILPVLTDFANTLTVVNQSEIDQDAERALVLVGREAITKVVEQLSATAFPHMEYITKAMALLLESEKLCISPRAKNTIAAQLAHIKGELASYGV